MTQDCKSRQFLARFFYAAMAFGGCAALFSWLILPMRSMSQFLGYPSTLVEKQALLIVVALIGMAVCYMLASIVATSGKGEVRATVAAPIRANQRYWLLLLGVACMLLWIRVCFQIGTVSLNWDELSYLKELSGPNWLKAINPLQIGNHWWAQVLNLFSMRVFGISEVTGRFSAVLFSACFLVFLYFFLRKHTSLFTRLLILAHLTTSAVFEWHAHSSRGYISLMFATLILFSMLVEFAKSQNWTTRRSLGFALAILFSFGCHGMSSLFVALLSLALLLYLYANRDEMSEQKRRSGLQLIGVSGGMLLLFSPMFYFHIVEGANYIAESTPSMFPVLLSGPLGLGRAWAGKLVFLSILVLLAWGYRSQKQQFAYWFVLATVGFFISVLWAMEKYLFSSRFLMPFVLPLLFWFGQSISELKKPIVRGLAMGWMLILLGAVPQHYHAEHFTALSTNLDGFTKFIHQVRTVTHPVKDNCYHFDGYINLAATTKELYLREARDNTQCKKRYLLVLGWEGLKLKLPNEAHWSAINGPPILRDEYRALYEVPPSVGEKELRLAKY